MKYSITIPAYKSKFLKQCIDSILLQTYEDFEIIIVNDASPEDLDSIVNTYNDSRIRYYKNSKNCGAENVVDNWNICLSYAKGDYVICMGDDDELAETCLEQYNLLMEKVPGLDIYHARVKMIDEESNFFALQEPRPLYESVYSMMWYRMSGRRQFIGDFLFKRSTLEAKGGFYKTPFAWYADDIVTFIVAEEKGIANTVEPTFYYRKNRYRITSTGDFDIKFNALEQAKLWYDEFCSKDIKLSGLDIMYKDLITSNLNKYFKSHTVNLMSGDLQTFKLNRLFYWLKNRRKYNLTLKAIWRVCLRNILKQ